MMKFSPQQKRLGLSLILLLAALAAAVGATYAIYTSQVYQRAVVRNRDTEAIRFSSDKLYRVNEGTPLQTYYYPMKDQTTMRFTVCNYDQTKNTVVNENDIHYTVTFSIPEGTKAFSYRVNGVLTDAEGNLSFSNQVLKGARSSSDRYTIDFGKHPYTDTKINVTVTPDNDSKAFTKNNVLQATLVPIGYATTQGVTLTHIYPDSTRGDPDRFAAYNLSVSISGGQGDVVINWKPNELDIDPFFEAKAKGIIERDAAGNLVLDEEGYAKLTIPMNSEDETGAYLIQFYNHGTSNSLWMTWNDLPIKAALSTD